MASYDSNDCSTQSLLFVSEVAKALDIDSNQIKSELGQKLMTRSAAITTEFENHVVDHVKESIIRFKSLDKEIYLDQRLSDSEKTKLMQLFSPPYKLKFSNNASDIGAHLYYRSLNEIATYRCYDLLSRNEKTPSNRDVLIKEVGASVAKIVKYQRTNVHACTPNLTLDDTIRLANTNRTLESIICDPSASQSRRDHAKRMMSDQKYRCFSKSEHCKITSKYLVFAHSSYDCDLTTIADMMDGAEAVRAIGFIHYSPAILSNITEGSDNGLNWKLECCTFSAPIRKYGKIIGTPLGHVNNMTTTNKKFLTRKTPDSYWGLNKKKFVIKFWFDQDYQNAYVHDLDTYLGLIRHSICTSRNKVSYMIQRRENLGGLLFYEIIRPTHPIPQTHISRMIPFADPDNIIIHYYQLQTDPDKYYYHELIPDRLVAPKKFFEKLYYYLFSLPDGKFTTQNAVTMASTMASRTVVNGAYVSQPYSLSIDLIDKIAHATYFIVYCRRYDLMMTLKKLKGFEDMRRNPTMYDRLCVMMRHVKNYVFGSAMNELKNEETFEDIIDNGTNRLLNDVALDHSTNIFRWLAKLFRINRRYKVDFFPITRVVSIEEDIEIIKNIDVVLPAIAPVNELDDVTEFIREKLHISYVDKDTCSVIDHVCDKDLYPLLNNYKKQCVLMCFSNRHNISVPELQSVLSNSKFFSRLFITNKKNFKDSIYGPIADLSLFELIACEFAINICVHTEDKEIIYDVKSTTTYHFRVVDNHCVELREKITISPFEFKPVRELVPLQDSSIIIEASKRTKEDKFKMHPVIVDTYFPYVCRSALKLHEMDSNYGIITHGNVLEISAAPGSWIQYCHLNHSHAQLYYTYYVDGLEFKYDHPDIVNLIEDTNGDVTVLANLELLGVECERLGRMNVVLSDAYVAKENEDVVDVEQFLTYQDTFFSNLTELLNDNGNVCFKSFGDIPVSDSVNVVLKHFDEVIFCKPNFSSPLSTEYYIIGKGFRPERDDLPDVSYHGIPNQVMNKVINKAKMMKVNKFPHQKKYTLPPVTPKASTKFIPEEEIDSMPEEEEEAPPTPITESDSFEDRLVKTINKLQFHDVPASAFVVKQENNGNPDFTHDVILGFFDSELISDTPGYLIYDELRIHVDFSTVQIRDTLTNLFSIANKIATHRLRIYVDLTGVDDQPKAESLLTHIKEQFARHDVTVLTNYTNCTASIRKYERSILEYITYTKSVKAANMSTYRFFYNQLECNSFVLTHTLKANVKVNTQNISIMLGDKVQLLNDNAYPEYTHVYCGVLDQFIPFTDRLPNRWYFYGNYTYRMFDDILMDRVSKVDVDKLKDVQFVLIQGVAGHGKTTEIVKSHKPSLKTSKGDMLITPTIAGKKVLIERTAKVHKIDARLLNLTCYRTVTSFLTRADDVKDFRDVYFDEAIMVHVALILATAYYSGAKFVHMYGDTAQIPAHSTLGDFEFKYHSPQSLFPAQAIRNKSHRLPADVPAALNDVYRNCHRNYGHDIGIVTTSTQLRSLNNVRINDITEMKNYFSENVKYLTFTHTTANDLEKMDPRFKPSTIAAFQGSEHPEIAIVRTSLSEADQIYNNENLCVTALTRHTKKLTYYTACHKNDFISTAILYANSLTDQSVKRFSTSLSAGSVDGSLVVPTYGDSTVLRFFKSRQKLTHSFTMIDHRSIKTEKEFALSLCGVRNDIFVDKSIFKRFSMPDMLKWIKKLAPHVKEIFVRVQNESFQNDSKVIDLVEDYKCRNVIQTSVTEKLVAVVEPYFDPEIRIENFISVSPTIELVQTFMSHLFPNSVYVPNQFDSYFVHTEDIEYTLKDVSFSPLWDRYSRSKFDSLRPVLSTPAPAKRDVTQREIILGIQKRNLNPPELVENVSPIDVAHHLLANFEKMLVRDYSSIINQMETITPTTQSIVSWLEKQDRSVLKAISNDIPICLASLSDCSLSLKRSPKVRISPTTVEIYDSVQTITCHPKFVNAYFCSVVDMAQDRLMKLMLPWFKIYTKKTVADFGRDCYQSMTDYGKCYMFSGDDSLLCNGNNYKEMDMSKFDKSQLIFALEFLCLLFQRLGVPKYISQLYYEMMYFRVCRDPSNKVTVALTPQMESGSAATYFGNTCFCAAVVLSSLDLTDYSYTPRFEKFAMMFNLEVKEFKYQNPYFCSKFVVIDENKFKLLPDPIKIMIKLGRCDLKNFQHMKEFHISLKDLVSEYDCLMDISVVSAAIRERYDFPYDCTYLIQNLISLIKDDKLFSKLFYVLPTDVLDYRAVNFSED
uniref:ORF1 n=1 Tax=Bustos virus TaxID=1771907 RepID=A0A6G7AB30_9VIRU|nr:ORF1 [Bustos virus]